MKQLRFTLLALLMAVVGLNACKKDEPEVFNVENFTFEATAALQNGQVVGTIKANSNKGTIVYSITSQGAPAVGTVAAGLAINSSTGEITVANRNAISEFACATANQGKYTAVVTITNGTNTKTANITLLAVCREK